MKIIAGGRRTGKTTKLIMQAVKIHSQIVCMDHLAVNHTKSMINILGLRGLLPPPITYRELLEGKMEGTDRKNISIDDAQVFLRNILGNVKIDAISIEKEDNE